MVATVRCEEIAGEKLKCFTTDEGWLKMKEAVQAGPVSGFGRAVSFILKPIFQSKYTSCLSVSKRSGNMLPFNRVSGMLQNSAKNLFNCDMLSEMMAKYKKQITHALAKRVESLLEAGERDTWASIRNLFECNTEAAVSEFSDAAVSFNLNSSEIDTKSQHLREHARNVLEMKAREAADAERVMERMMDRFSQVLSHDENSISWYNWTTERKLDEVERDALTESLRILSIIAAIRFDEMPDQIENVLYSSLMNRTVPDPSLQSKFMRATLDPLASDTWEEVSPEATTLLKPEDCKSLWMNFIEKTKPMVTGARSRQDGHRKTGSYAAAAVAAAVAAAIAAAAAAGAVVAGPAAVLNAGVATFMRVMRL
ncbi:hypothetical protein NC651_029096 [Populus alba x Populus x berolinensis]|nr:hypothetical protein NC651_029096 [Populus alba x Populus x berolinensis]